jgi:transcription-repair coupling factor (superfamily II helicase)
VASIHKVASAIQTLVPEAKVEYAHGQMSENELEDIIVDFLNGEFDVLVCTTIIETGLDMPNVNTIIIEDADKMGLAQLYQLRGRVGRSNRQAYAYLTFKKDKVLSEDADKRLKAIKEFTEFGSGFKIAMRDLEIRGAGNLIGPEQHGHMNSVGYDMYCKILEDAVKELKGEKVKELVETSIDLNISAYIDDNYINNSIQKITMYKKIAAIENYDDVIDIKSELMDRYGDMPKEVDNLVEIAYIKSLCVNVGILSLAQRGNNVVFTFQDSSFADIKAIGEISNKFKRRVLFTASNTPYITFKADGILNKLLENIKFLLQILNNSMNDKQKNI